MELNNEGFNPLNLNKPNPLADIDLTKICYFDTETTGVNPKMSQIVEIAAVLNDKEFYKKIQLTDETKKLIEYQKQNFKKEGKRDKTIEELLEMSNYYDEKVKADSTEKDALIAFKSFVEQADFLLAHNASFDMKMVNVRLKRYGVEPISNIPVLDSLAFSRRFFIPAMIAIETTNKNVEIRTKAKDILDKLTKKYYESGQRMTVSSTLGSLTNALVGQIENWHQAMADVKSTKTLIENFFKLLMDKHITKDISSDLRSTSTFKKYFMRNKRMEDRIKSRRN